MRVRAIKSGIKRRGKKNASCSSWASLRSYTPSLFLSLSACPNGDENYFQYSNEMWWNETDCHRQDHLLICILYVCICIWHGWLVREKENSEEHDLRSVRWAERRCIFLGEYLCPSRCESIASNGFTLRQRSMVIARAFCTSLSFDSRTRLASGHAASR